jgi:Ferric reductase like transmembrane component
MTASTLATSGGSALWYLARASGVVTLVLLTASVLLGVLTSFRWSSPRWPRFVVELVHRNVSLLVLVFLLIHVVTVVADPFAPINLVDAVVPFVSAYRPIWLGLGAVSLDLLVALAVTSVLRHRLGYKTWRAVHWLAYVCWPVAVLHAFGTGTDTASGAVLLLTAGCVVSVLVAVALRLATGLARRPGVRTAGFAAFALAPVLLVAWLWNGPLASGWARRAGTPESVLAASTASAGSSAGASSGGPAQSDDGASAMTGSSGSAFGGGFEADLAGTVHTSARNADGNVVISLVGDLSNGATGSVDVELTGRPAASGGVELVSSTVTVTANGQQATGKVSAVDGANVVADLTTPDGAPVQLIVQYTQLDQPDGKLAGVAQVGPRRSESSGGSERGGDRQ